MTETALDSKETAASTEKPAARKKVVTNERLQLAGVVVSLFGLLIAYVSLSSQIEASKTLVTDAQQELQSAHDQILEAQNKLNEISAAQQKIVFTRSSDIIAQVAAVSRALWQRSYLVHAYGGGASATCVDSDDKESLIVTIKGIVPDAYAGINFYGNKALVPTFRAVDLGRIRGIRFRYRYPKNRDEEFFVRLKNIDNVECGKITLPYDAKKNAEYLEYTIPITHPEFALLVEKGGATPYLFNISIAAEVAPGETKVLQLDEVRMMPKGE